MISPGRWVYDRVNKTGNQFIFVSNEVIRQLYSPVATLAIGEKWQQTATKYVFT